MPFQDIGLNWLNKGLPNFLKQSQSAQKAIDNVSKSVEQSAKNINKQASGKRGFGGLSDTFKKVADDAKSSSSTFGKALKGMGLDLDSLTNRFASSIPGGANFVNMLSSIPAPAGAAALAVGAAAAAITAFVALGTRGANFQGIIDAFKRTGVALTDLRAAAAGTISDIELMKTANIALAGATGQVQKEFGDKLPQLLEIARVQARATGQSVDFLFNSLVKGVKRSSPLLIDNTGLVLKVGEANEKYAESIGKTVDQLSAQEKQIALLEATLEAGRVAVEANANAQETAGEKLARIGARITNTFDRLAYAVQPAFEAVLDVVDGIVGAIESVVTRIAPVIQFIAKAIQAVFVTVGELLAPIVRAVANVLQGILDFIGQQSRNFAIGGARMFGAFVNGVAFVINRSLLPLIEWVTGVIADFLIGESPPPRGPLSKIDEGGRKVMEAWLAGFAGVSVQPVREVAQAVTASLGDIATFTLFQVEKRIRELDRAIQPFRDQLDIVKARFEALREPAEAAIEAIDRQIEQFSTRLASGDQEAAQIIRNLDARKAAIQDQLSSQQAIVDQAQIQLALVQAQQAEERVLLDIRKRQVPAIEQVAKASKKRSKDSERQLKEAATPKGKKPKAGSGEAPIPPAEAVDLGIDPNQFGESAGFIPDLDTSFLTDVGTAFLEPLIASGELGRSQGLLGGIRGNLDRISQGGLGNIGDKIADAFSDLPSKIGDKLREAVDAVGNFLFGEGEDSLQGLISSLPDKIPTFLASLPDVLGFSLLTPFGLNMQGIRDFFFGDGAQSLQTIINNVIEKLPGWLAGLTGEGGVLNTEFVNAFKLAVSDVRDFFLSGDVSSLRSVVDNFLLKLPGWLLNLGAVLIDTLLEPFRSVIQTIVSLIFGGDSAEAEFAAQPLSVQLQGLGTKIGEWLGGLGEVLQATFVDPIIEKVNLVLNWFTNPDFEGGLAYGLNLFLNGGEETEFSIAWLLNRAVAYMSNFPQAVGAALRSVGGFVWDNFAVPIIEIVNWVIEAVEKALNVLPATVNAISSEFNLGVSIDLVDFSEAKIPTARPAFLQAPGGASGGLFEGLTKVGEKGTEYVASAPGRRLAVFPNRVSNVLDTINSVLAQPRPQHVFAGQGAGQNVQNDYQYDYSMSNQIYNVRDNRDLMQRFVINRMRSRVRR